jgi:hypothetical protein
LALDRPDQQVRAGVRGRTCHFSGFLLAVAVLLAVKAALGVLGAEGASDALVGGVGLPVDAVGVDLQQDSDAVPGAAGQLGRRHPAVQPQRHRRVPQVIGTSAENTLAFVQTVWPDDTYANIGVTPMIGQNDDSAEVFTEPDAQTLVSFAQANGLGRLAFWSVDRDREGAVRGTPTWTGNQTQANPRRLGTRGDRFGNPSHNARASPQSTQSVSAFHNG